MTADPVHEWIEAVVERHTGTLSRPEFLKAVRALSARYVERRADLVRRQPVDSAGKRAAFSAFFAPLHLVTTREIVQAIGATDDAVSRIVDLGCGTGAASAGWALARDRAPTILGIDRQSWPLHDAAWNWRTLGLRGRTRRSDVVRTVTELAHRPVPAGATSVLAAWSINELDNDARHRLLPNLLSLAERGCPVLVIEPLARSAVPWWNEWADEWQEQGGQAAEWKFEPALPRVLAELSDAAGFRREWLGARTLWIRSAEVALSPCYDRRMDPGATAPTDDELVDGLRAGDARTFELLVRHEGPRMLSVTRRILKDDDEAREAVQEAFVSAFRARRQFNAESRISTWLHRIAVNAALSRLRSRRRRPEESLDDLLPRFMPNGHHVEHFNSWTEPADVTIGRRETAEQVRQAIDSLPETFRTVLMLRDIDGLSSQETASVLDISPNAVKLRLHRARMALRTLLAPHFQGASA